jgi:uncharacterized protein
MSRIEEYRFGHVVVDGEEQTRDVIVLPERVLSGWWRVDGHRLVLADLDEVIDELPERLLVGTGAHGQMRPQRTRPTPHRRCAAPDLLMSEFALESDAFENAQAIPSRPAARVRTQAVGRLGVAHKRTSHFTSNPGDDPVGGNPFRLEDLEVGHIAEGPTAAAMTRF